MFWEEVDVIGNYHQIANLEAGVHTTCSIGNEERLDAEFVHDTNREGDFLHGVTFIKVETPLHGHDIYSTEFAKDESAGMAFDRGNGEVWNILIGKFVSISYFGS